MMDDDDQGGCDLPGCSSGNGSNNSSSEEVTSGQVSSPVCSVSDVPDDVEEIWFSLLPSENPTDKAANAYSNLVDPTSRFADGFSVGVDAFTYVSVNFGSRGWFQKNILQWGPDAYSEIYYDIYISGISRNAERRVDLTKIIVENRFIEPIRAIKLDYYLYTTGSNYPVSKYKDFKYVNIATNSSFTIPINQSIVRDPLNQYAILGITVWTSGFWGNVTHIIQP